MRVFAYCCQSFRAATRRAAGVMPVTCPPVTADSFEPSWLEGCGFVYFDLHGEPGAAAWLGDGGVVAVTADQVGQADMKGAVVFAANCFLADRQSPMMEALLDAGARYVVGGDGRNWGPTKGRLYGAPLLGLWLRRFVELGMEPLKALSLAKKAVVLKGRGEKLVEKDTLAFRAYKRRQDGDGSAIV